MTGKVLVTYGSKHGATAEIAQKIGAVLSDAGLAVDVLPAEKVTSVKSYAGIVLGSGVYAGQWVNSAAGLLTEHESALVQRPVWLFSSGPTGEGDPLVLLKGWRLQEKLQPVADRIQPRDMAVFGGKMDPQTLSLPERLIIKMVKAPMGDFRDWQSVSEWAAGIGAALQ
jgi:menaquinone-dependent protoporphyrinogen oxidase